MEAGHLPGEKLQFLWSNFKLNSRKELGTIFRVHVWQGNMCESIEEVRVVWLERNWPFPLDNYPDILINRGLERLFNFLDLVGLIILVEVFEDGLPLKICEADILVD
jgi:hypothetical protein